MARPVGRRLAGKSPSYRPCHRLSRTEERALIVKGSPSRWTPFQVSAAFGALCLIWGITFVVLRIGLREAPPLTFTAMRAFLGGIALASGLLVGGRSFPVDRSTQLTALIMGATNVAGFWGLQSLALLRITPGETAVLIYVQPLLVAFLASLFLGERLSVGSLVGLIGGFVGVVLVIGAQATLTTGLAWIGYLCALGGAICWAIGTVFFKSRPRGQNLIWIAALQAIYGSIPLTLLAFAIERPHLVPTMTLAWTLAYAGFGASAIAYLLWFSLLRQHAASTVAAFVFLVPVVAMIADAALLGDHFGPSAVAGSLLIIVGIWLVSRRPPSAGVHKVPNGKFVHFTDRQ